MQIEGKNTRLVWSDDPKDQAKVDEHLQRKPSAADSLVIASSQWVAVFRIEKGGRGGKTVTVIDQLPNHETFVKALCKELKSKCGSGGTHSLSGGVGKIEIQGDKRAVIKAIFEQKGYRHKGM